MIVTHDVEFAALCADRCVLFFRGAAVSDGTPRAFFAENSFYTTAARRMTRGYFDEAVTVRDVVALCKGETV
jgi:energy-coupling factor transport system ATP-binding protein